jgi:hypothetical protein
VGFDCGRGRGLARFYGGWNVGRVSEGLAKGFRGSFMDD